MRSRASWQMIHGHRSRECEVSRYRHGCDPPKPIDPVLDCDPVPLSQNCFSDPRFTPVSHPYLGSNFHLGYHASSHTMQEKMECRTGIMR